MVDQGARSTLTSQFCSVKMQPNAKRHFLLQCHPISAFTQKQLTRTIARFNKISTFLR
jgi:hypothetical protein